MTIRAIARAAKTPVATSGDYFSGRHLPLDRDQFARILIACGDSDPARIEQWQAALGRARRLPGRRTGTPYRGLARFEGSGCSMVLRPGGRHRTARVPRGGAVEPAVATHRSFWRGEVVAAPGGSAATPPLGRRQGRPDLTLGESDNSRTTISGARSQERRADRGLRPDRDRSSLADGAIAKLAAEAAGGAPWAGRAAVIVDQFEAVFTLCDDEGERRALIEGLCDLAQAELVVLALRADFYQQAIRYPGLIRAAQERHVVLGPMSVEQVRRAVVEPARLAKTEVAPGLVEVLLADLAPDADVNGAHEPGALPMLSHALLTAWEHSHGGTLTVADYLAGGGSRRRSPDPPNRPTRAFRPRSSCLPGGCSSVSCTWPTSCRQAARRFPSASC